MSAPELERIQDVPYRGTITRRKRLAQEIRNELQDYRREAGDGDSQDARLERVARKFAELIGLEGLGGYIDEPPDD
jgi:hypothetical protein